MHPSVVRDRLIVAQQEIQKSSDMLAELLGIDGLKPIPSDARDEDERVMHRQESILEFLKRAVGAADEEIEMSEKEDREATDQGIVEQAKDALDTAQQADVDEQTEVDGLELLTPHAKTALYNAGVHTFEQVKGMSDEELLEITGVGAVTVKTLRDAAG